MGINAYFGTQYVWELNLISGPEIKIFDMNKFLLGCFVIFSTVSSYSQVFDFEQVTPQAPFSGIIADFLYVSYCSFDYADVDNDSDLDVLIIGTFGSGTQTATLYLNDGYGNYSQVMGTPFVGVNYGTVNFSDIDNDGDQDVLITGGSLSYNAKLYENDGFGNFTLISGTPFLGVHFSSVEFADIDNDGDEDVLITGKNTQLITSLFTNDGNGIFSEVIGTPFDSVYRSTVEFADIDNDNDLDVIISGVSSLTISSQKITKLYSNDGSGNFAEVFGTPFEHISRGDIEFSDIDNDGDLDVFISGSNDSFIMVSKLYTNNGVGNFSEMTGTTIEAVSSSSACFGDIDNDGDKDLLITGTNGGSSFISKLYSNDGTGIYTEILNTPFEPVSDGEVKIIDADNDADFDLIITGSARTHLYINDGNGNFQKITGTVFTGVYKSAIAFSDIDNDGDQDIYAVMGGAYAGDVYQNALFVNPGHGNHWLNLRLEGVDVNRSAIGARIRIDLTTPHGSRQVFATVSSGGSFGASSLQQEIGLGKATAIDAVEIFIAQMLYPQALNLFQQALLPLRIRKVMATGTTAGQMVAFW